MQTAIIWDHYIISIFYIVTVMTHCGCQRHTVRPRSWSVPGLRLSAAAGGVMSRLKAKN